MAKGMGFKAAAMSAGKGNFDTHTGLTIDKAKQDDGSWLVRIYSAHEMERAKALYSGADETAAQREYAKWVKHYEERAKVESA